LRALRAWLHRRQRPARYALLDDLLATQGMSRAQVLAKQQIDLHAIVRFAAAHTAYYHDKFGALPADFTPGNLPILHKEDVVTHLPNMLSATTDLQQVKIGHTGGSTGKPLAFYYDASKHELMRAGMMRSYMMSGWRPGQKILNFWGARQDTVSGGVFGSAAMDDFISAEKTIPAHAYTPSQLQQWANFIRNYRPVLLQGYASILAALARYIINNKLTLPDRLLGVYSTAEVLDDGQRELMEQAFGCKVFNQYGSREIPNIACECRHGNMHVFTDMVHLESLEGRLIVTSLTNRLMPMIRYDIGDSGQAKEGDCACGSPFPLMEMGMCRQNDLIRTPGGKHVHPAYFNGLLYGLTQIENYQFIQNEPERITLNVVSRTPLDPAVLASLEENIRQNVDARMALELNYVPEIERTVSGKHRFVISTAQP
jgi:phenylacetate-CoA ligase